MNHNYMNKKTLLITGSIITALCISVLSWQLTTHSALEESRFIDVCSTGAVGEKVINTCCVAYQEGFQNIKDAWANNQIQALDQEKSTSEKINDVFEGYNTYKCWGEYLCRAVQFSGFNSPDSKADELFDGLSKKHIGTLPGCQDPEDLEFTATWNNFVTMLKDDWQFFVDTLNAGEANLEIDLDLAPSLFTTSKVPFIPQCMADKGSLNHNLNPFDYSKAGGNYSKCMDLFHSKFGCDETENCDSLEIALVTVETALRRDNANQKASALENKLSSIITKMHSMQQHTEYLKANVNKLNDLYECYPSKCT